ncbi:MAG: hypothetical protein HQ567_17640 [Candidatus Nealsonbacteria bacterium]|nr:hypothetical protein [Candidatus Nealsonbacteria bacterium]
MSEVQEESPLLRIVATPSPSAVEELPGGELPPEHLRTSFFDTESSYRDIDKVYLPMGAFGHPPRLFLHACLENVPMVEHLKHVFVPASWIVQECPYAEEVIGAIVKRVVKAAGEQAG